MGLHELEGKPRTTNHHITHQHSSHIAPIPRPPSNRHSPIRRLHRHPLIQQHPTLPEDEMRPLRLGTVRCAECADEKTFAVGEEGVGEGFLGDVVSDMYEGGLKEGKLKKRTRDKGKICRWEGWDETDSRHSGRVQKQKQENEEGMKVVLRKQENEV
jgi:hypothetical protein